MSSKKSNAKDKLSKTDKEKKIANAFEQMLEDELDGKEIDEDEKFSVDELSDDEESSSESSDILDEYGLGEGEEKSTVVKRKKRNNINKISKEIFKYMKSVRARAGRSFIDYGPPYSKKDPGGNLGDECADYKINLFFIHNLLNSRANPNVPDPRELYMTPMHWCARFYHLLAMRMLRRAKAAIDPVNELGQTPLSIACMFNPPQDCAYTQIKMVKWLVRQGNKLYLKMVLINK